MIKTEIHSPPLLITFKSALPNTLSKFGLDGGPGAPLPSHFPKSARAGVQSERGGRCWPTTPGAPQTQRRQERLPPLCLACGTSGGSWSCSAHLLRASPPSHSPRLSPTSPGPSFPLCYSHPGLYCSQPTWLLSDTPRAGSCCSALPANLAPLASLPHLDHAGASPITCSQPHWWN